MQSASKLEEVLLDQWRECHGAFYQVRREDVVWNFSAQDLVRYEFVELGGVPCLIATATDKGAEFGISSKTLWISLFGRLDPGGSTTFVEAAEKFAKDRAKTRLMYGGDEFHFLPGVPEDPMGDELIYACRSRDYQEADSADYVGKLQTTAVTQYITTAQTQASQLGWSLIEVARPDGEEKLREFLQSEFKGRWSREFEIWRSRTDTSRAFWNILKNEQGIVVGFSRLGVRGRYSPGEGWSPGALRLPQSEEAIPDLSTDACLGPIGVSSKERGRGAGRILLGLSLQNLLSKNAERLCIDWTNAYNYYKPLEFQVVRRYRTLWKDF